MTPRRRAPELREHGEKVVFQWRNLSECLQTSWDVLSDDGQNYDCVSDTLRPQRSLSLVSIIPLMSRIRRVINRNTSDNKSSTSWAISDTFSRRPVQGRTDYEISTQLLLISWPGLSAAGGCIPSTRHIPADFTPEHPFQEKVNTNS